MRRENRLADDMDQAFPDGKFSSTSNEIPGLRFRDMDKWCQKHGKTPDTLTSEELDQFRI